MKRFEDIFDGTLGMWNTKLVDLEPSPSIYFYGDVRAGCFEISPKNT